MPLGNGNDLTNRKLTDIEKGITLVIVPYYSAALEASAIIKASETKFYSITFVNTNGGTRYLQLFNSATLPADAVVPILTFPVATGVTFTYTTGEYPNLFSNGLVVCNSSTLASKTIGSADSLFYVQYI